MAYNKYFDRKDERHHQKWELNAKNDSKCAWKAAAVNQFCYSSTARSLTLFTRRSPNVLHLAFSFVAQLFLFSTANTNKTQTHLSHSRALFSISSRCWCCCFLSHSFRTVAFSIIVWLCDTIFCWHFHDNKSPQSMSLHTHTLTCSWAIQINWRKKSLTHTQINSQFEEWIK